MSAVPVGAVVSLEDELGLGVECALVKGDVVLVDADLPSARLVAHLVEQGVAAAGHHRVALSSGLARVVVGPSSHLQLALHPLLLGLLHALLLELLLLRRSLHRTSFGHLRRLLRFHQLCVDVDFIIVAVVVVVSLFELARGLLALLFLQLLEVLVGGLEQRVDRVLLDVVGRIPLDPLVRSVLRATHHRETWRQHDTRHDTRSER